MRTMRRPVVCAAATHRIGCQVVTKVIVLKSIPAAQALQAIRPMMPQFAHVGAVMCVNALIIADRYGNVKRLSGVIEALDKGEPYKPQPCSVDESKK